MAVDVGLIYSVGDKVGALYSSDHFRLISKDGFFLYSKMLLNYYLSFVLDEKTIYSKASSESDGLMSQEDKTKLDGLESIEPISDPEIAVLFDNDNPNV